MTTILEVDSKFNNPAANIKFVMAPDNLPDVKPNTKMNVIYEFTTDSKCPFGAGLKAIQLQYNYLIVFTNTEDGIAWLKSPSTSKKTHIAFIG